MLMIWAFVFAKGIILFHSIFLQTFWSNSASYNNVVNGWYLSIIAHHISSDFFFRSIIQKLEEQSYGFLR